MCIFSCPVHEVSGTQIFARRTSAATQVLVYSMRYAAERDVAMILPLPKAAEAGEDAVRFIDLSSYPGFFADLNNGFPAQYLGFAGSPAPASAGRPLKVHEVGRFVASWVPSLGDFERLDPVFRLPAETWSQLPGYADSGFAVFQLRAGKKTVHPMAFEFPTREPDRLFFPTVHIHDGEVAKKAHFNHVLYCQSRKRPGRWLESAGLEGVALLARKFVSVDRAKGLLLPEHVVFRMSIFGLRTNEDCWVAG